MGEHGEGRCVRIVSDGNFFTMTAMNDESDSGRPGDSGYSSPQPPLIHPSSVSAAPFRPVYPSPPPYPLPGNSDTNLNSPSPWPPSPYRGTSYGKSGYSDDAMEFQRKNGSRNRYALLSLLLILVLALVSPMIAERIVYSVMRGRARAEAEVARELLTQIPDGVERLQFAARAIRPSVVGIEVSQRVQSDLLSSLFGQGPGRRGRRGQGTDLELVETGQGSGVIVDVDGYIITNNHVVENAGVVAVRLFDGTKHTATVVGTDPKSDVAVLKIDVAGLTAAVWGDSDAIEVGQQVLAVGSPFGLNQTVTSGIISAKERRSLVDKLLFQDFLQTDAAINPGNSGGPLVNLAGEVVGINTMIVGDGFQGIGFAIPSRLVQKCYEQLRRGETIQVGYLGISLQKATPRMLEQLGHTSPDVEGVVIVRIERGSPADLAGLQPGELIVAWNGRAVSGVADLQYMIADTPPGTIAPVTLHTPDGSTTVKDVRVGKRP